MNEQSLLYYLELEDNNDKFNILPFHLFEISKILFKYFSDDFQLNGININKSRILLKDIEDKRNDKIKKGYGSIKCDLILLELNGITSVELNKCRNYLCQYLDINQQINEVQVIQNNQSNNNTQNDYIEDTDDDDNNEMRMELDNDEHKSDDNGNENMEMIRKNTEMKTVVIHIIFKNQCVNCEG